MRNDDLDLRADRDELDHFTPRSPPVKRQKSLVLQVALGVFLGGLALWLVQLGAGALMAKLAMGTFQFGGWPRPNVGAVELQRGRDSGGSGTINVDCADAIAASLKLDSSHRNPAWLMQLIAKSAMGTLQFGG